MIKFLVGVQARALGRVLVRFESRRRFLSNRLYVFLSFFLFRGAFYDDVSAVQVRASERIHGGLRLSSRVELDECETSVRAVELFRQSHLLELSERVEQLLNVALRRFKCDVSDDDFRRAKALRNFPSLVVIAFADPCELNSSLSVLPSSDDP